MEEFDFIGPDDHPALLAINTPETLAAATAAFVEMGYKVHAVDTHPQFDARYNQVNYQAVVIEEDFGGGTVLENASLQMIQALPMARRRYATFFLIGPSVESLNAMQAFAQSVHCVLNFAELAMLPSVAKKTITENDVFLGTFREVERRLRQKGV
ncbi:MAG TPA: hypothetical protein VFC44_27380 [Candidatus Saccharimonadales bacterium]|nr:hypothetical protein [Candidatus Saccharimonadales bacterium]